MRSTDLGDPPKGRLPIGRRLPTCPTWAHIGGRVKTGWGALMLGALVLAACNEEKRITDVSATAAVPATASREVPLVAGPHIPGPETRNPFENNQHAVSQGQRLFRWFNCSGCHSTYGGGGMGPPLIDDHWIYGNKPANIYETIVNGRPNGMPSFGGKIPSYQVWQIVAYVQSMPMQPSLEEKRK
jgi:cytochrome c oxidase cbb3-type subunit III